VRPVGSAVMAAPGDGRPGAGAVTTREVPGGQVAAIGLPPRPGRIDGRRPALAVVVVVFTVSRVAYALAGVRFLWQHAPFYLHFIDPDLLRHRLLQSLWYDHAQPPGLNLIWGMALKVSPAHPDRVLWPLFLGVGLATSLVLLRLLERVGLASRWAVVVTALWTVSPTAVTMETYLLYTPLEVLGVLAVALFVARWSEQARTADAVGALAVASALALTRATFHLVWIVGLVALLAQVRRDRWRVPAVVALLPLVVVGGWYVKNLVLFDQFGTSSWLGPNLARVTVEQLSAKERVRLSQGPELSAYAPHPAFATFEEMHLPPPADLTGGRGVPLLQRRNREGTPFPNQRYLGYLAVDRARLRDAAWVIGHRPGVYARGIRRASSLTFGDPVDFFGYGPNVDHIEPLVAAERRILGGWTAQPPPASPALGRWGDLGRHEWVVLAAYLVALAAVPLLLVRRRVWRRPAAGDGLVLATWGTVTYLTVLTVAADFGENNRFRSVTDPAVLVLLAWLMVAWRTGARPQSSAVKNSNAAPSAQ